MNDYNIPLVDVKGQKIENGELTDYRLSLLKYLVANDIFKGSAE